MKAEKLFSILVVVSIACYGAIGYYFLPLANFEGDLSRVGMLPESLFGWTKPQPAIEASLLQQAKWEEADALVIGDSFSAPGIWQTALTRAGLRVRTETWTSLPALCEDFSDWAHKQGFRGRYVFLEIIERNTEGTLGNSIGCKSTTYRPVEWQVYPPATHFDRDQNARSGRLSIGLQVYLNAWRYEQNRKKDKLGSLALPGGVHAYHLAEGCKLFSHPRCEDALFFDQDRSDELGEAILNDMKNIASRITAAQPVWVIVPDKSTTYLHPDKQFWNEAERRFHAPNILDAFKQATRDHVVDLYLGNNTHLSTTGYLLMGEAIYQSLPHSE